MPKNEEEAAWSDNDEIDIEESDNRKKRCVFCHELLEQLTSIASHEKSCKIAKKCNASRVLCKSGIKKFVCDICYSTFEFLKSLVEHEKRHIPPGAYFCNYCDEQFCTECEKQKHTENSHKVYQCRLCKNLYETSESYIEHIKLDHNGKQTELLPCKKCSRMFTSEKILQRHIDSNCGINKRFQCHLCHKSFTTKGILKTHMLIHAENKAYVCPYCGKGFHNKYQLKSHEISHTGEKPWKCNVCFAEFSWKQSLVTHSTLHTGVKPYICECCGSRFSCTSNLIAHRKKRADTCGLPQYCTKLSLITPRPSIYNPEMLTTDLPIKVRKNIKVVKESDKQKYKCKQSKTKKVSLENNENTQKKISRKTKEVTLENLKEINDKVLKEETESNSLFTDVDNFANNIIIKKCDGNYEVDLKIKIINEKIVTPDINKEQPVSVVNEIFSEAELIISNSGIKSENIKIEEIQDEHRLSKDQVADFDVIEGTKTESCLNTCDNLFNNEDVEIKEELKISTLQVKENDKKELQNDTIDESSSDDMQDNDNLPDFDSDNDSEYNPNLNENSESQVGTNEKYADIKTNNLNKLNNKRKNSVNNQPVFVRRSKRLNGLTESQPVITTKKKRGRRKIRTDSRSVPLRKKSDLIKCPFCDSAVYRKYSLKKHLKRMHQKSEEEIFFVLANIEEKGPSLDCDICKKKFTGKLSYEKHCKLHGHDKSLTIPCHDCYGQRFFRNRDDLKEHVRSEHNDLKCEECNKIFKLKSSFKEHVLRIHKNKPTPTEPTITCIKCGKLVKKGLLRDHERSNCGQEYLYGCKICLKKFSTAGILKEHTKLHTGELTAFCKFCAKGFRNKYQCQQHEMVHTGEKPYKCTYDGCTAAFAHRNNMINHFSLHTGLRRYMCSGCTERFSCISSLKAHWRTHADSCALHPENSTKAQFKVSLIKGQIVQS